MAAEAQAAQPPRRRAESRQAPGRPAGRTPTQALAPVREADGRSVYKSTFEPNAKHPCFVIPLDVKTEAAHRVFMSTYDATQKALYHVYCIFPIQSRAEPEKANAVIDTVEERFLVLEKDMDEELARLQLLAKTDGAAMANRYFNEERTEVVVMTRGMGRFIGLINKMDQIVRHIDALWFSTRMNEKDRNNRMMEWRNKITRFHRFLSQVQLRAQSAANRHDVAGDGSTQAAGEDIVLPDGETDTPERAPRKRKPGSAARRAGPVKLVSLNESTQSLEDGATSSDVVAGRELVAAIDESVAGGDDAAHPMAAAAG